MSNGRGLAGQGPPLQGDHRGERAGTVGHGQQESFEVVPGAHEVFLKLDWCRSPKLAVDVAGGQHAKVMSAAGGNFWMTFFDVIFRPTRYIRAEVAA
jgi:hypothetical protein